MINALTIDVEEYFHVGRPGEWRACGREALPASRVDADMSRVLGMLETWKTRATFFVVGQIARSHPRLVTRIVSAGHEVGCHGFEHLPVEGLSPEEFAMDLDRSLEAVGSASGMRPAGYRSPLWSLSRAPWAMDEGMDALVSRGFSYDASLAPIPVAGLSSLPAHARVLRRRAGSIVELPPLTGRFGPWRFPLGFGLGLRLLPTAPIARAIAEENHAGRPATVAFHPWELDPDPPVLPLPTGLAIAHGFCLERLAPALERLVGIVRFGTAQDALDCFTHSRRAA